MRYSTPRDADAHLTRTILASLDLTELAQRHPLSLSGGQMQRGVALAAALLHQVVDALCLTNPWPVDSDLAHMRNSCRKRYRSSGGRTSCRGCK